MTDGEARGGEGRLGEGILVGDLLSTVKLRR